MNIVLIGLSSFTGIHFANALQAAGHSIAGGITKGSFSWYTPLQEKRLIIFNGTMLFNLKFGDPNFQDILQSYCDQHGPIDIFCHHGSDVTNYKSDNFDYLKALNNNVGDCEQACKTLSKFGCKTLVYTGSYFEANEGGDPLEAQNAVSKYGLSKTLTSEVLRFHCKENNIQFKKFVIPNPFGELENPGLISYLVDSWKRNEIPIIKYPDYQRDFVPVYALANCYSDYVSDITSKNRPSFLKYSVEDFCHLVSIEFQKRSNREFRIKTEDQQEFKEPRIRKNYSKHYIGLYTENYDAFWDRYYAYYFS